MCELKELQIKHSFQCKCITVHMIFQCDELKLFSVTESTSQTAAINFVLKPKHWKSELFLRMLLHLIWSWVQLILLPCWIVFTLCVWFQTTVYLCHRIGSSLSLLLGTNKLLNTAAYFPFFKLVLFPKHRMAHVQI